MLLLGVFNADAALNAECLFLDLWRERSALYIIQNPGWVTLLRRNNMGLTVLIEKGKQRFDENCCQKFKFGLSAIPDHS